MQDRYPEEFAHCFGCGRRNAHGHQLKTYPHGEEAVAHFTPQRHHTALPGFVYGGLIASLIDCHSMATAAAAVERATGHERAEGSAPRFVTAGLRVDYLRPTPLGPELELRGRIKERTERKVVVETTVSANGQITARGEVVAVRVPASMLQHPSG